MSIKFFSGLQDLLGLYDSSAAAAAAASSSPSSPIPPTIGFSSPASSTPARKRSAQEVNHSVKPVDDESPIRRCSHTRIVHFPEKDADLIRGYVDAPRPLYAQDGYVAATGEELLLAYREGCVRHHTPPLPSVERQLQTMHSVAGVRQELLSLKSERMKLAQLDAIEEIFRRVQFETLDMEYTFMDDDSAIALAELLEFYDSAIRLNLSFNNQITLRGWQAIFRAVRTCASLSALDLRYTSLSEKALPVLCRSLRASPQPALTCLHLENVDLAGKNLLLLVCALKTNTLLKELYLGENSLQPSCGAHIYQLITSNTSIQMLDLRNNQLQDAGVRHICDALRNSEAVAKSALTAIVLWNNRLTADICDSLAQALLANSRLETLNIGSNEIGSLGIARFRHAIQQRCHLRRLGLQSTNLDCQSAIMLAECVADNSSLLRLDLRDNPIASAGLLALHSAIKMNSSITLLNLDQKCAVASSEKDEFRRYLDEIREYCERNRKEAILKMQAVKEEEQAADEAEKELETTEDEPCASACADVQEEATVEDKQVSPSSSCPDASVRRGKFQRSASLTCNETVHDIHERIREMGSSSTSLDGVSNAESIQTIKRPHAHSARLSYSGNWGGSLPSLSDSTVFEAPPCTSTSACPSPAPSVSAPTVPAPQPVVRKTRRFSVSPTTSTLDISKPTLKSRPVSLPLDVSLRAAVAGPASAPVLSSSLPISSSAPSVTGIQWPGVNAATDRGVCSPVAEASVSMEREAEASAAVRLPPYTLPSPHDTAIVNAVVRDLVNYVVYDQESVVERKASVLMRALTFEESAQLAPPVQPTLATPLSECATPSSPMRGVICEDGMTDEETVTAVVRGMVKEVLVREREELRVALERKRRCRASTPTTPLTPLSPPNP